MNRVFSLRTLLPQSDTRENHNSMKNTLLSTVRSLGSCVFLATLLATGPSASADVIVFDDFSLNGTTRVAGGDLSGTSPTIGSNTWVANGSTVFSSAGSIVAAANNTENIVGKIAIADLQSYVQVEANIVTGSSEWMAVGLQSSTADDWFSSQIFVLLTPGGAVHLFGPNTTSLMITTVPNFDSAASYKLTLKYDYTSQSASVWVNDTPTIAATPLTLTSSIGSAGFYGHVITDASIPSVDNFTVTSVPEVGPLPSVLLGVALLVSIQLMRRQRTA